MKTLIMATSVAVSLSLAASASNNNSNKHGVFVSDATKDNFSREFPAMKNVSWSADDGYMIATFMQDNAVTFAYFDYDGDPVATVKEVNFTDLPETVRKEIQEKYGDYTVSQALQFTDNDPYNESSVFDMPDQQAAYFVSLLKGNEELILQVDNDNKIAFFEKRKDKGSK